MDFDWRCFVLVLVCWHGTLASGTNTVDDSDNGRVVVNELSDNTISDDYTEVIDRRVDALVEKRVDALVEKRVDALVEKRVDALVEKRVDALVEKRVDAEVEKRIDALVEKRVDALIEKRVDALAETRIKALIEERVNTVEKRVIAMVEERVTKYIEELVNELFEERVSNITTEYITDIVEKRVDDHTNSIVKDRVSAIIEKGQGDNIEKHSGANVGQRTRNNKTSVDTDELRMGVGMTTDFSQSKNKHSPALLRSDKLAATKQRRLLMEEEPSVNSAIAVGFSACVSVPDLTDLGANHIILFDRVITNAGNGYHENLGAFLAPVKGLYAFHLSAMTLPGKDQYLELMKDGVRISYAYADASTINDVSSTGNLWVLEMDAGSEVWIQTTYAGEIHGNCYTMFSGFLLAQMP